jgi:type I restriction enzyme S subunit
LKYDCITSTRDQIDDVPGSHQSHGPNDDNFLIRWHVGFDRLLIGYAAVVPEYFTDGGIYSHHVYRVRPNSNSPLTARYLERWINSPLPHEWITGYSNGTTVNMLPMDGLTNAQVLLPPREIIHAFTDIANSIAVQQQANDQASMHYSQARDLLLPQLMSGQMLNVS